MLLVGHDADRKAAEPRRAANERLAVLGFVLVEGAGVDERGEHVAHFEIVAAVGAGKGFEIGRIAERLA